MKNFWNNYVNRSNLIWFVLAGIFPIGMSWPTIQLIQLQIDLYQIGIKYGFQTNLLQLVLSLSMNFIVLLLAVLMLILIIASLIRSPQKTTTSN